MFTILDLPASTCSATYYSQLMIEQCCSNIVIMAEQQCWQPILFTLASKTLIQQALTCCVFVHVYSEIARKRVDSRAPYNILNVTQIFNDHFERNECCMERKLMRSNIPILEDFLTFSCGNTLVLKISS